MKLTLKEMIVMLREEVAVALAERDQADAEVNRLQKELEELKASPAIRHYKQLTDAQTAYYNRKAGPVESRRPRGRPKKEHWVVETESQFLQNTGQAEVGQKVI
jgi:hypothetical protein